MLQCLTVNHHGEIRAMSRGMASPIGCLCQKCQGKCFTGNIYSGLVQLVEHRTLTADVRGSSPRPRTNLRETAPEPLAGYPANTQTYKGYLTPTGGRGGVYAYREIPIENLLASGAMGTLG